MTEKQRQPAVHLLAAMNDFILEREHITLAQAIKAVGMAGSGGQAKHLVRNGSVKVNDAVETQPGRKLFPGDRFRIADDAEWKVRR